MPELLLGYQLRLRENLCCTRHDSVFKSITERGILEGKQLFRMGGHEAVSMPCVGREVGIEKLTVD
jgi:hypothetical protein